MSKKALLSFFRARARAELSRPRATALPKARSTPPRTAARADPKKTTHHAVAHDDGAKAAARALLDATDARKLDGALHKGLVRVLHRVGLAQRLAAARAEGFEVLNGRCGARQASGGRGGRGRRRHGVSGGGNLDGWWGVACVRFGRVVVVVVVKDVGVLFCCTCTKEKLCGCVRERDGGERAVLFFSLSSSSPTAG